MLMFEKMAKYFHRMVDVPLKSMNAIEGGGIC